MKNKAEIIERLRNDDDYYGDFGKQFLSNSDIGALLGDPTSFHKPKPKTANMLLGSYMHTKMLEPEKLEAFIHKYIVDVSSRNTKTYKCAIEFTGEEILLLKKETEIIDELCAKMLDNFDFYSEIKSEAIAYEEPNIVEIHGNIWKCKADIVTDLHVPDIKTTGDISKFHRSAYDFNYDSAAYIYEQAFGKRMKFLVGCKKTGQIGMFECSDEFVASGEQKVAEASIVYETYFGENATLDIDEYYTQKEL